MSDRQGAGITAYTACSLRLVEQTKRLLQTYSQSLSDSTGTAVTARSRPLTKTCVVSVPQEAVPVVLCCKGRASCLGNMARAVWHMQNFAGLLTFVDQVCQWVDIDSPG